MFAADKVADVLHWGDRRKTEAEDCKAYSMPSLRDVVPNAG
jgi:hypothetical protein